MATLLLPTRAARAARSKSFLLDLPPTLTSRPPAVVHDQAASDPYLRMLSSPLRRCLLTQQVLPSDMMIQLKLARPPPTASGAPKLVLTTPNRVLHPRFAVDLPGRGAWVVCWKDGMDALRKTGSYKRLAPSAVFPSSTSDKIHSQLARRVAQECVMLAERAKSWPASLPTGARRDCPVARVTSEEWETVLREGHAGSLAKEGHEALAVLSFSPSDVKVGASAGEDGAAPRTSTLVPSSSDPDAPNIPLYHLSHFFSSVTLSPLFSTSTTPPTLPSDLESTLRGPLDSLISLFDRRKPFPPPPPSGPTPAYVVYRAVGGQGEGEGDEVPLLVALWRCRLWSGEGWGGVSLAAGRRKK